MVQAPVTLAAGAVVTRMGPEVLLVHRAKYDDWSFPKGKLDPGEHATTAAVREVAEETGLDVRLGVPLPDQHYEVAAGPKVVRYWAGRVDGGDDVSTYRPNAEIDEVAWVPLDAAARLLTYSRDRATLEQAAAVRKRTTPLVVLRHGQALPRKRWDGDDRERPLLPQGDLQSEQVVPVLGAYGVRRVLSSSSRRCWRTVAPYADLGELDLQMTRDLSEQDASERGVERHVHRLLERAEPAVLCTHRPVLPKVYAALGLSAERLPKLQPGGLHVVHHRRGRVVAVETHQA